MKEHIFHEFELSNEQIEELIEKLKDLKESQEHIHFDLNQDEELFIKHKKRSLG